MKPKKLIDSIFTYDVLVDYEPEELRVWGARFIRDFGPWRAGDWAEFIFVDYEMGEIVEETADKRRVRGCRIKLEVEVG